MSDLLNITYTGNLVRDAEVKETTAGNVTKLRTASNSGRDKDAAVFLDVDVWRRLGETCAVLKKGDKIGVSGKLKARVVEKDGKKMTYLNVDANEISFLSKKQADDEKAEDSDQNPGSKTREPSKIESPKDSEDDLGGLF